jgi:hypothetical protein
MINPYYQLSVAIVLLLTGASLEAATNSYSTAEKWRVIRRYCQEKLDHSVVFLSSFVRYQLLQPDAQVVPIKRCCMRIATQLRQARLYAALYFHL